MNGKQSISVLLMLGLIAPLASCGNGEAQGGGKSGADGSPAVTTESPSPQVSPSATGVKGDEGGEGGEG